MLGTSHCAEMTIFLMYLIGLRACARREFGLSWGVHGPEVTPGKMHVLRQETRVWKSGLPSLWASVSWVWTSRSWRALQGLFASTPFSWFFYSAQLFSDIWTFLAVFQGTFSPNLGAAQSEITTQPAKRWVERESEETPQRNCWWDSCPSVFSPGAGIWTCFTWWCCFRRNFAPSLFFCLWHGGS